MVAAMISWDDEINKNIKIIKNTLISSLYSDNIIREISSFPSNMFIKNQKKVAWRHYI